jgi:hypothetical protein
MNVGSISGQVAAGSGVTILARLRGQDGSLVTQASLTSIAYSVANLTEGEVVGTGSLTVSTCVYDSLQTDARWTQDTASRPGPDGATGYNFAATLPASLFPETTLTSAVARSAPPRVQVDVTFTPTSGQPFRVVWSWTPVRVWG